MAKKSKLLQALDNHKGVDHKKAKQKKLQKQAEKRKRAKNEDATEQDDNQEEVAGVGSNGVAVEETEQEEAKASVNGAEGLEGAWETDEDEDEDEDVEDEEDGGARLDASRLDNSESESESEIEWPQDSEAEDEEDDIPLSDIESLASEDKEDIVPHQRVTINNTAALLKAHKSFAIPISKLAFSAHQSITSEEPVSIPDIDDDLNRELAFYSQSLAAVNEARALLKAEGVPFSRPTDYFAEMVKSDEHMGRVKQKLVDTAAGKKAATEARRQRDLKKFGKAVQVAKEQERAKQKRETLEKINTLKRKRQGAVLDREDENDIFDVALEDAATTAKKDRAGRQADAKGKPSFKRQKRDDKYGFGGKKRFAKSNDATSTSDMRGFSTKKMKGKKTQRPGKSRRAKNL